MNASPSSLITRLRRRLAMVVWAFAFIVAGQSAFATACVTDGLDAASSGRVGVAATAVSADAAAHEAPCWHAGAGGCHCTCLHASGLVFASTALPVVARADDATPLAAPAPYLTRVAAELRPPIA